MRSLRSLAENTRKLGRRRKGVSRAVAGTAYSLDELRISKVARYANLSVAYGPQQTFNPIRFTPPTEPFQPDAETLLLLHFDDNLKASVPEHSTARLSE